MDCFVYTHICVESRRYFGGNVPLTVYMQVEKWEANSGVYGSRPDYDP